MAEHIKTEGYTNFPSGNHYSYADKARFWEADCYGAGAKKSLTRPVMEYEQYMLFTKETVFSEQNGYFEERWTPEKE